MSTIEFSNVYQQILLDNLTSIIKQNFIFQTQIKLMENVSKENFELQSKFDELLKQFNANKEYISQLELYKSTIEIDTNSDDKNRIQIALNDFMIKNTNLQNEINSKDQEIEQLKKYIFNLEQNDKGNKRKKNNSSDVIVMKSANSDLIDSINTIKSDDGSSF